MLERDLGRELHCDLGADWSKLSRTTYIRYQIVLSVDKFCPFGKLSYLFMKYGF